MARSDAAVIVVDLVEHQNFVWANSSMTGKRVGLRASADVMREGLA